MVKGATKVPYKKEPEAMRAKRRYEGLTEQEISKKIFDLLGTDNAYEIDILRQELHMVMGT